MAIRTLIRLLAWIGDSSPRFLPRQLSAPHPTPSLQPPPPPPPPPPPTAPALTAPLTRGASDASELFEAEEVLAPEVGTAKAPPTPSVSAAFFFLLLFFLGGGSLPMFRFFQFQKLFGISGVSEKKVGTCASASYPVGTCLQGGKVAGTCAENACEELAVALKRSWTNCSRVV